MSIATETVPYEETASGQTTLNDFGADIAEYRTVWEFWNDERFPLRDVYVTGPALFSEEYDMISLTVSAGSSTPWQNQSAYSFQQSLEANLAANEDRETLDELLTALYEQKPFLVLDEEGREGIPLGQRFEVEGTSLYVEQSPEGKDLPAVRYAAVKYLRRRQTPQQGNEILPLTVYDNLHPDDRVSFDFVISRLKELDAPLCAVGGITRDHDYEDIDIAVDVGISPSDSSITNSYLTPLEWRLEQLSGKNAKDITMPDSPHKGSWEWEYGSLTKRYRFSFEMDGHETTFDIGAMNNPFVDNPDRRYAKL